MATLVLSVAGTLVGGPIGGMIGASLGQAIDREVLFRPKGREGPRLSGLAVQTSSYGTQIPKLFGAIRVAGSVIWAADLVEHSSTEGGKGRPSVTSYSYTASFAVALSGRAIGGVGRIWAEGKLLRGASGDFKTATGFRLHLGSEEQEPDPLIAAAEGEALAPAHRGIAYAVFEDMELAEYGNRIPSLTFEVFADAAPLRAGEIMEELSGGTIAGSASGRELAGFSAHGASARAAVEALAAADGGWFASEGAGLALVHGTGVAVEIEDAGAGAAGKRGSRGSRAIAAADTAPRALSLAHYDPARDYQIGVQRATRPGAGTREARIELPAVIDAGAAKTIAEGALSRSDVERERRRVALVWEALAIRPGERVTIADAPGLWRVDRWGLEAMVVTLDCVRIVPAGLAAEASPGRVLPAPDLEVGTTLIHAFDLPPIDDMLATAPRLAIAAAGSAPGWREAALLLSTDGGARWETAGRTAPGAVIGEVVVPPGAAPASLADRANILEVELAHAGMVLADADDAALCAGANLALVGEELLQFGEAVPLGGNRWRLRRLWRGRAGTEAAAGAQAAGERFVLIRRDTLKVIELAPALLGGAVRLLAQGVGDSEPAEAQSVVAGRSLLPPSPVHLCAAVEDGGLTRVRWVRRSRIGWRWLDGADAPLGEESERYRIAVASDGSAAREVETSSPWVLLEAADREVPCLVTVCQAGSHGLSQPAFLSLPPLGDS